MKFICRKIPNELIFNNQEYKQILSETETKVKQFYHNKFIFGGTIFAHKNIHLATWISLDPPTKNQIDHICISKRFKRTLEDVEVKKEAGVDSDDHLVTFKLKLKLKQNWTKEHSKATGLTPGY